MPESKKLSELIEFLIVLHDEVRRLIPKDKKIPFVSEIEKVKNQIDQKFEELRCECNHPNILTVGNLEKSFVEHWLKKTKDKEECCLFESFRTKGKDEEYLYCSKHSYRGFPKTNSCWSEDGFMN